MSKDPIAEGRALANAHNGPGGAGFKNSGKLNAYQCRDCRAHVVTIDREPGVTPFLVRCRNCGGEAQSAFYRLGPNHTPTYEWVRPESLDGLDAGSIEHIRNGGLILRPIAGQSAQWIMPKVRWA